jgi:hypothetical protein
LNVKGRPITIDDALASAYENTFGEPLDADMLEIYLSLHRGKVPDIQAQLTADIREDIVVNGGIS